MNDEFFLQEKPAEDGESGSGGGEGGGGGISQGGWGSTGPAGGGGGGGGGWGDGDGGGEDEEEIDPDWGDEKINRPFLRYLAGYLIVDQADGKLLTGSLSCNIPPALVIRGEPHFELDEDGEPKDSISEHTACVLLKCDPIDPPDHDADSRIFEVKISKDETEQNILRLADFSFCRPGSFTVSVKWQAGHYDYAQMNKLCSELWGISTGFKQAPLTAGQWQEVFTVTVTDEFSVIVNQQPGNVRSNSKYFENKA